jgi:hypothetical protein
VPSKKPSGGRSPKSHALTGPDVRIVHALRRLVRTLEINSRRLAAETGVRTGSTSHVSVTAGTAASSVSI